MFFGKAKQTPIKPIDCSVTIVCVTNRPKWMPFVSHQINKLIHETRSHLPKVRFDCLFVVDGASTSEFSKGISVDRYDKKEFGSLTLDPLLNMSKGIFSSGTSKMFVVEGSIGHKRNWAMTHAKGDYIVFVDDDDVQMPGRIIMSLMLLQQKNLSSVGQIHSLCGDLAKDSLFFCTDEIQEGSITCKKGSIVFNDSCGNELKKGSVCLGIDSRAYTFNLLLTHGGNACPRVTTARNGILSDSIFISGCEKVLLKAI